MPGFSHLIYTKDGEKKKDILKRLCSVMLGILKRLCSVELDILKQKFKIQQSH